jgi:hypothetical protein
MHKLVVIGKLKKEKRIFQNFGHQLIYINSTTLWFGIFIHTSNESWHQITNLLQSQVSLPLNKKIQQSFLSNLLQYNVVQISHKP